MKILLTIRYNGSAYCGYQYQPNGKSIQERLNAATEEVFGFPCDIVGSSRTDAGVHALGFCATVAKRGEAGLQTDLDPERIPLALNAHLPEDISVIKASFVPDDFHARYDVKQKEYLYRVYNSPYRDPFEEGRSVRLPKKLDDSALERMQKAAQNLLGKHDFSAYMAQGSKVVSTERTLYKAEVVRDGDLLLFRFAADGFLYNMVRILVGTLISVGEGKIEPEDIPAITDCHDRSRAGQTMPACGLYLAKVTY